MSQAELERFAASARANPALADDYANLATVAEVSAKLRQDGFDVADAEVEELLQRGGALTDEQLDHVSGGAIAATLVGGAFVGLLALGVAGAVGFAPIMNAIGNARRNG